MCLVNGMKKGIVPLTTLLLALVLIGSLDTVRADYTHSIDPAINFKGFIPLTPGASTTVALEPRANWALTIVLCLGEGTLEVVLTKDDTENELVSMFVLGFPADPSFIPNFGITPAEISVSTEVTGTLAGQGVIFIITVVNSSESHTHELSLELD